MAEYDDAYVGLLVAAMDAYEEREQKRRTSQQEAIQREKDRIAQEKLARFFHSQASTQGVTIPTAINNRFRQLFP